MGGGGGGREGGQGGGDLRAGEEGRSDWGMAEAKGREESCSPGFWFG